MILIIRYFSKLLYYAIITQESNQVFDELERQAEQEILEYSRGNKISAQPSSSSDLVIGQTKGVGNESKRKYVISKNIANESDTMKFKRELTEQAGDVDFKSDTYVSVPVDQFGAALLRGMGWADNSVSSSGGPSDEKLVPREQRLGLGAVAAPSMSRGGRRVSSKYRETETLIRAPSVSLDTFLCFVCVCLQGWQEQQQQQGGP